MHEKAVQQGRNYQIKSDLRGVLGNAERGDVPGAHHADSPVRDPPEAVLEDLGPDVAPGVVHRPHEAHTRLVRAVQRDLELALEEAELDELPRGVGVGLAGSRGVEPRVADAGARHPREEEGEGPVEQPRRLEVGVRDGAPEPGPVEDVLDDAGDGPARADAPRLLDEGHGLELVPGVHGPADEGLGRVHADAGGRGLLVRGLQRLLVVLYAAAAVPAVGVGGPGGVGGVTPEHLGGAEAAPDALHGQVPLLGGVGRVGHEEEAVDAVAGGGPLLATQRRLQMHKGAGRGVAFADEGREVSDVGPELMHAYVECAASSKSKRVPIEAGKLTTVQPSAHFSMQTSSPSLERHVLPHA